MRWLQLLSVLLLGAGLQPATAQPDPAGRTFAVRLGPGTQELEARLERYRAWFENGFDAPHRLVVGPDATGDTVLRVERLPAGEDLKRRLAGLPVELGATSLSFAGTVYDDPGLALALRLPDAPRPTYAVVGWELPSLQALTVDTLLQLARPSHRPPDYLLWEHRWSQRSGRWQKTGRGIAPDPKERNDFARREATYAALASVTGRHVKLLVPPERSSEPVWTRLAVTFDAAVEIMAPRLPVVLDRPIEVIVEADWTAMGRHLADLDETLLDAQGRLHLVDCAQDLFACRYGLARALVRRAGLVLPPWIEDGAALYLAGDWYGQNYRDWLRDFVFGDVLPSAAELVAQERQRHSSEILWPPVAAAVVERLAGDTLRQKLGRVPAAPTLEAVLRDLAAQTPPGTKPKGGGHGAPPTRRRFHHGVSLAMAPGNIEGGYHATAIDDKLRYLRAMGCDSVSIIPLAMKRSPQDPEINFAIRNPTDETDAGLMHAARRAHALGFEVLWKPQVYVGSSWPGEIRMSSEEDWQTWWRRYRRYILHHAVLARWSRSELFTVGVEMGKTVEREAEWRHLIQAVRRIYPGRLTYAGNWWGDYDRVPFWDALDYVGVDAYFPLASSKEAGRSDLAAGARHVVDKLEAASRRFGKPVILTELGYAANEAAWVAPHREGGAFSVEDQALAYEVFLEALGRPPWLRGLFLWKVFSHRANAARSTRPDFRFTGRPAEDVVRAYFTAAEDENPH